MDKPGSTVNLPPGPVHCFPNAHIRIVGQASCKATDIDLAGKDIHKQEGAVLAEQVECAACVLDGAGCVRGGQDWKRVLAIW